MFQHLHTLGVALCTPRQPFHLAPQLRASPHPVHRSTLAYRMPVARQPLIHRIGVSLIPVSARQPIRQAQERRLVPAAHLIHPSADTVLFLYHLSHIHMSLRRSPSLTPKYVHFSSNAAIDARSPLRRPLVHHTRIRVRRSVANALFLTQLLTVGTLAPIYVRGCR